jgi:hypothetical protein
MLLDFGLRWIWIQTPCIIACYIFSHRKVYVMKQLSDTNWKFKYCFNGLGPPTTNWKLKCLKRGFNSNQNASLERTRGAACNINTKVTQKKHFDFATIASYFYSVMETQYTLLAFGLIWIWIQTPCNIACYIFSHRKVYVMKPLSDTNWNLYYCFNGFGPPITNWKLKCLKRGFNSNQNASLERTRGAACNINTKVTQKKHFDIATVEHS